MSIFCRYPFDHIYSDSTGMMMPCCAATTNHPNRPHVDSKFPCRPIEDGMFSYRDLPEMKQLRSDMMRKNPYTDLVKDVCRNCIRQEEEGKESDRVPIDARPHGRIYEVKVRIFGNTCNLQCYMCHIRNSSNRIRQTEKMIEHDEKIADFLAYDTVPDNLKKNGGTMDPIDFDRCLDEIKKNAHKINVLYIIGGEPFVMGLHYKVLDALIECGEAKNITLKYDSNLTKLQWEGCKIVEYIHKFRKVLVSWSIESYGKYDEYIRFPTKWEDAVKNYHLLAERPNTKIDVAITLSALSVLHLDELMTWLKSEKLDSHWNTLDTPEVCRIDSLHPEIRKRLSEKYAGTELEFLCSYLDVVVDDWESRWYDLLRYLKSVDFVNGTDYKKTFPELNIQ
jgi:organic radical activating enzyme